MTTKTNTKSCSIEGSFFYFLSLKTIALIILLFGNLNLLNAAQNNASKKQSLPLNKQQIQIDEQNLKAFNLLKENYATAIKLAKNNALKAKKINYKSGIYNSEIIVALAFININKSKEASAILNNIKHNNIYINDINLKAKTQQAFGLYYYNSGQYDTAAQCFIEEKKYTELIHDTLAQINALLNLGKIAIKQGNLKLAKNYHENALKIIAKTNSNKIARHHDLLGEIYHAQKLFQEAIKSYQKGIFENANKHDIQMQAGLFLHLGNAYYMLMQDDSAKHFYQQALTNFKLLGDSNGVAICFSNLSRVFLELGNYQTSIDFALKAINSIHDGNYKPIELGTLHQLGDIYGELKQYKKADFYLKKALLISKQNNQKFAEIDCYKSLSEVAEMQNNHAQSYQYLIKAYHLKDSLQPIAFNKQLAEMQTKYETEKKEKEIAKLSQLKINNQLKITEQFIAVQRRNYIIAGVIALIFILLIGGTIFYKQQKEKQNKINEHLLLKQQQEERQRIAKDLHDEIGSGLSKIALLSALTNNKEIDQVYSLKTINSTAQQVIENMRDLIWTLKSENRSIEHLVIHLREYALQYLEEFPIEVKLNIQENFTWEHSLSNEIQHHLLMCFKEILNNIVKHANATAIVIDINLKQNQFEICVSDNGIGMNEPYIIPANQNGLANMKQRMNTIGGSFELESQINKGTIITLKLNMI